MSSAVDVKKRNGTLGVCRDPMELNRYVKVPELSTIDDITSKLGKSQVFTVLDALGGSKGFLAARASNLHTP